MGKSIKFYVKDDKGKLRKVNPAKPKFDGKTGTEPLEREIVIFGHVFKPGVYPYRLDGVQIYDAEGYEVTRDGYQAVAQDVTQDVSPTHLYNPDPPVAHAAPEGGGVTD